MVREGVATLTCGSSLLRVVPVDHVRQLFPFFLLRQVPPSLRQGGVPCVDALTVDTRRGAHPCAGTPTAEWIGRRSIVPSGLTAPLPLPVHS